MGRFKLFAQAALATMLMAGAAQAEEAAQPWQDAITGQIEAFRAHDATAAYGYATTPFQAAFPNPELFFVAIAGSSFGPIVTSSSHSFGNFRQLDEQVVAQYVQLTGSDLNRYQAVYLLVKESAGWRVQGVQLTRTPGMNI